MVWYAPLFPCDLHYDGAHMLNRTVLVRPYLCESERARLKVSCPQGRVSSNREYLIRKVYHLQY